MRPAYIFTAEGHTADEGTFWRWLRNLDDGCSVDTETAGLAWDDAVRLVQFGDAHTGFAIDPATSRGLALIHEALEVLRGPIIFHNAGFDIHALGRIGVDCEMLWRRAVDTYVLAHVADPEALHGLDAQNAQVLGNDTSGYKKEFRAMMRKRGWSWATVPRLLLAKYGISDTCVTRQLANHYQRRMTEVERAVVRREMQVARDVWEVERHGMRLDATYAKGLRRRWVQQLDADREWFAQQTYNVNTEDGFEQRTISNPNANAQLAAALIERGWKPKATTPSGKPKLDKEVIKQLADEGYPIAVRLLEYKRRTKWLAAYVNNCLAAVDSHGYVHASYNSLGAKTGRMSCSQPPLQQLPKGGGGEIRRLFVASPGNVVASVDYSAVEFRLAGALSGDRRIIDVYEAGGDWYSQVAADLRITRPEAKIFVLAILYGARGRRIGQALHVPFARARKLVEDFWASYSTLAEWNERLTADAECGVPIVSWWGRTLRPHAPYAAGNAVIQGTAAEVMKAGLLRMEAQGLLPYVCAIVHDEVVLDVPRADAERVTELVSATLSDLTTFACPLVAEGKIYGRSWGDGYSQGA